MFPFDGPSIVHQIVPELKPEDTDIVLAKPKPSAFYATQLAGMLTYLRVDSLIVTGMTHEWLRPRHGERRLHAQLPRHRAVECVADRSQLSHRVELFDMGVKYADIMAVDELVEQLDTR